MNKQLQLHTRTYNTIRSKYISEKKEFEKKFDKTNLRFLIALLVVTILFLIFLVFMDNNPHLISDNVYLLIKLFVSAFIAFLFIMYCTTKYRNRDSFICFYCLHNIIPKKYNIMYCNLCYQPVHSFADVIEGCPNCHDTIRFIKCPICNQKIDLDAPYDVEYLKRKRYEFK
jgi:hypothetical protein